METIKLTDQQSLRIAELPEDYRVIGVDRSAPFVRKPTGQIMRIQQNGSLTAVTIAANVGPPTAAPTAQGAWAAACGR
jgi:hypothetical protein